MTLVYVGRVEESAGNEVASLVDLAGDLAGTFPRTPSSGSNVDPELADADLAAVLRDGYVVLPDLLSETDVDEIRRTVEPLLDLRGRNGFEGAKTQRVYSVLNKTRSCDRIADHPRVLALLDRVHSAGRAPEAAREARRAGFEHVNLDLIYGTPGETDDDLARSVDAAVATGVDHVSAYALVVEDGTALARRVRRGEITPVDDDVLARRYELLDGWLARAGLDWYEVSNWSRPGGECRHNLGYWNGGQWWGAGPGAHSFAGDTRWWNLKLPAAYADALAEGRLPVAGSEVLDPDDRHVEEVLLGIRLRDGLPTAVLDGAELARSETAVAEGLLRVSDDRLVLTDAGRLLADGVVRSLLG